MKANDSYMELCIHRDKDEDLYLRVPTVWDDIEKQWIGFVKTPDSRTLIMAKGKNSFELQNDFNREISKLFAMGPPISDEIFAMFMPAFYWEEK